MLTFDSYEETARKTTIYPSEYKLMYPVLGLAGEAGEIANKVKKIYRDNAGELTEATREALIDELGDVLWYVAAVANDLGTTMERAASLNNMKLLKRLEKGTLKGSGDNR